MGPAHLQPARACHVMDDVHDPVEIKALLASTLDDDGGQEARDLFMHLAMSREYWPTHTDCVQSMSPSYSLFPCLRTVRPWLFTGLLTLQFTLFTS